MLRRAENVYVSHKPNFLTGNGPVHLHVGNRIHLTSKKMHKDEFQGWLSRTTQYPVCFGTIAARQYWLFQGKWHWDNDGLSPAQVHALLVTKEQRTQQRINRAQGMVAMQQATAPPTRGAIPDDLKQYVWQRDGGRCRQCGSNIELQFDHIIPLAFGGATTEQNLQILCGPCNRRKGASII